MRPLQPQGVAPAPVDGSTSRFVADHCTPENSWELCVSPMCACRQVHESELQGWESSSAPVDETASDVRCQVQRARSANRRTVCRRVPESMGHTLLWVSICLGQWRRGHWQARQNQANAMVFERGGKGQECNPNLSAGGVPSF